MTGSRRWIRGLPGLGRSRRVQALADDWRGPVLWVSATDWRTELAGFHGLPERCLVVVPGIADGVDSSSFPGHALVSGGAPGEGWEVEDLASASEDEGVRLFLEHAPGAQPLSAVAALVRRLEGHPTAILAAARRWPLRKLDQLLAGDGTDWPGLRSAYEALDAPAQEALALLAALPVAERAGLEWCGLEPGLDRLVAAGWVSVREPGRYRVNAAVAAAVRSWKVGRTAPYLAWIRHSVRPVVEDWDRDGGSREQLRTGLWPTLAAEAGRLEPWLATAWSLSGESPAELLQALRDADLGDVGVRCAARAHQALGDRQSACRALAAGSASDGFVQLELGVAHQRLRDLPGAEACYRRAHELLTAQGAERGVLLCEANLAAVAHDRGDLVAARQGYDEAIRLAGLRRELRLRGMMAGNLGALELDQGRLDTARQALEQATKDLLAQPDSRFLGIVKANMGSVALLEGHLEAADALYMRAVALLEGDPSSVALALARRGAVAALAGRTADSVALHADAEARVSGREDPLTAALVRLWRVVLTWQQGDRTSALARRREAIDGLVDRSDEARLVVRLFGTLVQDPGGAVVVGPRGGWFQLPGETRTEIARFGNAARILHALADAAERQSGVSLDADMLIEAAWPGERLVLEAARNRLSVALAKLRKLGLREVIQRTREGWRLDPAWPVVLLREDAPPAA